MSGGTAGLERGYRRLLACYPRRFRDEHGEELLAVLLASAGDSRNRPGLFESADLVRNGLGMRLRPDVSRSARQGWSDALAAYSVAGPVLLLLITITEALLQIIPNAQAVLSGMWRGLCLMLAIEAVIIALVMAGRRKTALAALVPAVAVPWLVLGRLPGFWGVIPGVWTSLTVYSLEAVALIASPGPRCGRRLVHWGHWAVLLAAIAAVEAYEFMPFRGLGSLAAMVFLIFAVNRLGRTLRLSRYYLLLLAATFYPTVFDVAGWYLAGHRFMNGVDVAGEVAMMFAGPVLCAAVALGTVIRPRRRRII